MHIGHTRQSDRVTFKLYLPKAIEFLKNLRLNSTVASMFFRHDNALLYCAQACTDYLDSTKLKLFKHLPKKELWFFNNEDLLNAWNNVEDDVWGLRGWKDEVFLRWKLF